MSKLTADQNAKLLAKARDAGGRAVVAPRMSPGRTRIHTEIRFGAEPAAELRHEIEAGGWLVTVTDVAGDAHA